MAKKSVKAGALSALRMPGFTAEVALYEKSASYRMVGTKFATGGAVEAAFYRCRGSWCCDEWGDCIYKGPRLM